MVKFAVFMEVHGTAVVHVEADHREQALCIANDEFYECGISICHQCSDQVMDPSYGVAVDAVPLD